MQIDSMYVLKMVSLFLSVSWFSSQLLLFYPHQLTFESLRGRLCFLRLGNWARLSWCHVTQQHRKLAFFFYIFYVVNNWSWKPEHTFSRNRWKHLRVLFSFAAARLWCFVIPGQLFPVSRPWCCPVSLFSSSFILQCTDFFFSFRDFRNFNSEVESEAVYLYSTFEFVPNTWYEATCVS